MRIPAVCYVTAVLLVVACNVCVLHAQENVKLNNADFEEDIEGSWQRNLWLSEDARTTLGVDGEVKHSGSASAYIKTTFGPNDASIDRSRCKLLFNLFIFNYVQNATCAVTHCICISFSATWFGLAIRVLSSMRN